MKKSTLMAGGGKLSDLANTPREKIHWALRLLQKKGHLLGELIRTDSSPLFEIDGKQLSAQEVYRLVSKFKEWNDRLGLGTARIPSVSRQQD